jgi:hypothetical protein
MRSTLTQLVGFAPQVDLPGPKEAEQALVGMINAGEIHASIDQLTGTVSFHDDDEKFDTEASLAILHAHVEETGAQVSGRAHECVLL